MLTISKKILYTESIEDGIKGLGLFKKCFIKDAALHIQPFVDVVVQDYLYAKVISTQNETRVSVTDNTWYSIHETYRNEEYRIS